MTPPLGMLQRALEAVGGQTLARYAGGLFGHETDRVGFDQSLHIAAPIHDDPARSERLEPPCPLGPKQDLTLDAYPSRFGTRHEAFGDRRLGSPWDALQARGYSFTPTEDTPYPTMIAEISPQEFEQLEQNKLALPRGWSLENAVPFDRPKAA